ncbi:hypothetical protein JTE90_007787 [Oedothorax gibbosus]|uniref:MADF domain-containing protein n=1 Tax=Oedothorax gibbosus TaxID=931172 RepID=A0AAV6TKQ0_9ARAC|nr:hypothetical protein JTE90_007787 [Oedothorax gibbosus]
MDDFDDSESVDSDAQAQSSDSEFECVVVRRKRKSARKSKPTQRWTPEKPAKKPRTKKVVPAKDEDIIVDIESLDNKIFDDDQPPTDIFDGTISKEDEFEPFDTVPADIFEPVLEEDKLTKAKSLEDIPKMTKNLDGIPIIVQLKSIVSKDARQTKAEDLVHDDNSVTIINNDANQLAYTMDEFITVDELEDDFMPLEEGYTEWTDSLILQFIDEYKARPVLWNTKHPLHKSKLRKKNTWIELSNIFKIKVPELKRKMSCLLATYRKSFKKVEEVKEEMGLDYSVTWFAYRKFDFLKGIYKPVKKVSLLHCKICH